MAPPTTITINAPTITPSTPVPPLPVSAMPTSIDNQPTDNLKTQALFRLVAVCRQRLIHWPCRPASCHFPVGQDVAAISQTDQACCDRLDRPRTNASSSSVRSCGSSPFRRISALSLSRSDIALNFNVLNFNVQMASVVPGSAMEPIRKQSVSWQPLRRNSSVSSSQLVAQYLPYLRRYARALTGSQGSGDAYVAATLESLITDPKSLEPLPNRRVALYRLFTKIWNSVALNGKPDATTAPNLAPEQHITQITPRPRQAFLLVALEGFSEDEAAQILDVDLPTLRGLVEESG